MERQSTNSNSSTSNISSSLGNLSSSTLVQLDTRDATVPSAMESHQLSSDAPASNRHILDNNHDTDFDLNVPYVPLISNSDISDENFDTSPSAIPQDSANCGQKMKALDGSFVDNEGYHGNILHDNSLPNTYRDSPFMSQGPSTWREDTSGVRSHPEYNYGNVHPRRSPETVRGNLLAIPFTYWSARTSVNSEGEITHTIQAETRWSLNFSNQVAGMTQSTGTTSNGYITLFGNVIGYTNHPRHSSNIGSSGGRSECITLFGNVIHCPKCPCPDHGNDLGGAIEHDSGRIGIDIGSVNEREFIAQSNAWIPMPYAPLEASSSRVGHPDDMADDIQVHPSGHAENQDEATDIDQGDDDEHYLDLILGWLSDEEIEDLLNEVRVGTPLSQEEILQSLNPRKYQSSGRDDEGEQENCCICLDELGAGQDLVKLDCGHGYHFDCIKRWLAEKNCCALCKRYAVRLDRD